MGQEISPLTAAKNKFLRGVSARSIAKGPIKGVQIGRKCSPKTLCGILNDLSRLPVLIFAIRNARIHRDTLDTWRSKSVTDEDLTKRGALKRPSPFLIEWRDKKDWFHRHMQVALVDGDEQVLEAAWEQALGYHEVLTYQGRVKYQLDEFMYSLGFRGPESYLRDAEGKPIPEMLRKQDPEMIRWLAEKRFPQTYGKQQRIDVAHSGGVLVIGMSKSAKQLDEEFGGPQEIQDVEFEEIPIEAAENE